MSPNLPKQGFYAYVYRDPKTLLPFYVGKGCGRRALKHLAGVIHNAVFQRKLESLFALGLPPTIEIYPAKDELEALALEIRLIAHYGRRDCGTGVLMNQTEGGEGTSGRTGRTHTEVTKARISAALKGRQFSPEHCKRISEGTKGRPGPTPEVQALALAARLRPECRKKLSESAKRLFTPERQEAMVLAARMATKGVVRTVERRAAISVAQRGRVVSAETRARQSASQRLRYAK